MAAVAHSPEFAKKVGIKQSVGQEFVKADKGKKFGTGGRPDVQAINKPKTAHGKTALFKEGGMAKMKHDDLAEDKKLIKKAFGMHDKQEHPGKKTDLSKLKGGGMATKKMCGGGKMKKMAAGGMTDKEPRSSVKGIHPIQKQSRRGAEKIVMKKGGKC